METLTTERLILREWKKSDSKDLYEYAKSELVGPNAGWPAHEDEEESKEVIEMFIESREVYAVVLKEENKVIGSIGLHDRKPNYDFPRLKQKEIGYVLNPKYWGRGLIPEATNRLIKHGFQDLDLDVIWCGHFDSNHNSKRVVEKCGFKYRFKREKRLELLDNKKVDILYYSMDRFDYIQRNY